MARNWGITLAAHDVAKIRHTEDFDALVEQALKDRGLAAPAIHPK